MWEVIKNKMLSIKWGNVILEDDALSFGRIAGWITLMMLMRVWHAGGDPPLSLVETFWALLIYNAGKKMTSPMASFLTSRSLSNRVIPPSSQSRVIATEAKKPKKKHLEVEDDMIVEEGDLDLDDVKTPHPGSLDRLPIPPVFHHSREEMRAGVVPSRSVIHPSPTSRRVEIKTTEIDDPFSPD
jgi:hypothetical protein